MKLQFSESICPSFSDTEIQWHTAYLDPSAILAVIECEMSGAARPGESVANIVFASGFRWTVRAKDDDWAALTAMLERKP
jgi:hypothetical protein